MQSDSILVEKTLAGDTSAYGELISKYQDYVYGLAFHIVKNFADAQDLVQEAFLKAYLNLSSLKDPNRFVSWLRRITANVCLSWISEQKANQLLFSQAEPDEVSSDVLRIADPNPTPEEACEKKELQTLVMKAIEALPEKNRLVVTLFYLNGHSYNEIADFLDITPTTVQSRLQRARKQLKKEMLNMVEKDFGEKKIGLEFAEDTVKAVRELSETLKESLPLELLEYVRLPQEERRKRPKSIFAPLRDSFPPEKFAEMEQQRTHLAISELSPEQREYLRRAIYKFHLLSLADDIVNQPEWFSDFDNCQVEFGRYPDGKSYIRIFRPNPDGSAMSIQIGSVS